MKSLKRLLLTSVLALSVSTAAIAPAMAATMNWTIDTTDITDDIQFQLYSQSDDEEWPDTDQGWSISGDEYTNTYAISCVSEEVICFGGWEQDNTDHYWGVGLNDRYNDSKVCHTCGLEKNVTVNLTD